MTSPADLFPELERLGEQEVRTRLAQNAYGERKIPIVKEWLRQQEEQRGRSDNSVAAAHREAALKIQKSLRNATWIAALASVLSVIALVIALRAQATNERASTQEQQQQQRAYIAKRRGECYDIFVREASRVANVVSPVEYDSDDDVCRIRYRSIKADSTCALIATISDTLHYPLLDRRRYDCETQTFTHEF